MPAPLSHSWAPSKGCSIRPVLADAWEQGMTRPRNFLLLVTLAAVAARPAFGQPAVSAASIPDFSGMWAHASIPGFEPLASGPTSLINRSRRNGISNLLQL